MFERRVTKQTPRLFRTREITEGIISLLHIDYEHSLTTNVTRRASPSGSRLQSTTHATSRSASGYLNLPAFGGSTFKPANVS